MLQNIVVNFQFSLCLTFGSVAISSIENSIFISYKKPHWYFCDHMNGFYIVFFFFHLFNHKILAWP